MSYTKYILEGHEAIPADLMTWAAWFEKADRHVDKTDADGVLVSTVFLGLDHSFGDGPPLLFESMIFGGENDGYQDRCSTWDEAVEMHKKTCALAFGAQA